MKSAGSTVSDVLASALRRHGVTTIFGQSNPTALTLAAERVGIRQVLYRTENAGGAMADGFARVSNRIGVLVVQNGPAATLAVAPMAEALKVSIPMLVLVQEVPLADRDRNAFQELDHVALFDSVSKWTRRVDDPARAEDYLDLAMAAANSGRPGPVVLLLPKDLLRSELEVGAAGEGGRSEDLGYFPLDRPRPDAAAVARAAALLAGARSPVVIAGGGVHVSDATEALARLSTRAGLPVATTHMGKGAVDETAPLSLGVAANVTGEKGPAYRHLELIRQADVVLLVGTRTNENGTDGWTLTNPSATYVHIDADGQELGRNYEAVRLLGDARAALDDLTEALEGHDLRARQSAALEVAERITDSRRQRAADVRGVAESDRSPVAPERVMRELANLLGPDDIVAADASYSSMWVSSYLTAQRPGQRFLLPRGLAGLGWGLPLAMGAKLARPAARVACLVGDGGFAHVWAELETAVREDTPVVVIVLNNAQLGMQRHGEMFAFGETSSAIEFAPVDHAAIARACGASGVTVDSPDQLAPALRDALAAGRTTVIDVLSDPDAHAPLGIFNALSDAVGASR